MSILYYAAIIGTGFNVKLARVSSKLSLDDYFKRAYNSSTIDSLKV